MAEKNFSTNCIHGYNKKYDTTGAISVPIFQSATFAHPAVGESTGYDYSRLQNPTREHLEKTVANLEGGIDSLAFSTGMAAITTLMALFSPGNHIIASDDLYGGSHRLFHHVSMKNGILFDFVDTSDAKATELLIRPTTRAIFIETPTNPMMQVTDIKLISTITKTRGLLLVVDNTFLTPYYQKPLSLGADIVMHSGTKFLGGHNDTLAGFLVTNNQTILEKLQFLTKTIGAGLAPMDSWLIIRGIKTLPIRMDRQQETAMVIANWLKAHPSISTIHYIGLPDHISYDVTKKQCSGFGSMISFEVDTEETAIRLLDRIALIQYAESLGGVESLMTYPMTQTHSDVPIEVREKKGINSRLLRLSVGLEDVWDLINDLEYALRKD
ncbi:MAG: PLP-dependent aspartate aminotransferase family protein [Vallitaleaceae bacterium]|jgi:cystathionine gamma-synthase|nr:PLP-dependent aspartate aminotransferase family protein [Vallitaleaceae bacterium]